MSRKDLLNSIIGTPAKAKEQSAAPKPDRVRSGAINAMGSSLQELTRGAREAAHLQEQLAKGDHVVLLDPAVIDQSPIADRLVAEFDPDFDQLVESIRISGQQVPVLVRPNDGADGRFQIAYGRRRLRAVAVVGVPVRAIVRNLTDDEMVVAQGRENLDRADLSFIERALFAKRLEDAGYQRSVVMAALSTDKSDLSRFISVARQIPEGLARHIGPAMKAGRARWIALAEALNSAKSAERIDAVVSSDGFRRARSDDRFAMVFKAVVPQQEPNSKVRSWSPAGASRAARVEVRGAHTSITFDDKRVPAFADYVAARLDQLYTEFKSDKGDAKDK